MLEGLKYLETSLRNFMKELKPHSTKLIPFISGKEMSIIACNAENIKLPEPKCAPWKLTAMFSPGKHYNVKEPSLQAALNIMKNHLPSVYSPNTLVIIICESLD